MVSLKIEMNKKDFIWVGLIVVLLGVGFGYAYGGGNPAIMGHSAGELEVIDTNVVTVCPNNQFLDGDGSCLTATQIVTDGGGGISKACTFCLSCGGLWPTSSGRIYSYYAPTGAYSSNCAGTYPAANRWVYLCCK